MAEAEDDRRERGAAAIGDWRWIARGCAGNAGGPGARGAASGIDRRRPSGLASEGQGETMRAMISCAVLASILSASLPAIAGQRALSCRDGTLKTIAIRNHTVGECDTDAAADGWCTFSFPDESRRPCVPLVDCPGPAVVRTCEPVPAGCESDRTCACAGASLCPPPFDTCRDLGRNTMSCDCPQCQ